MNLTATTHSLELVTLAAISLAWQTSFTNIDKSGASTVVTAGSDQGAVAAATTTAILAAPAASNTRTLTFASFYNDGASQQSFYLQKNVSGTPRKLSSVFKLAPGETALFLQRGGWQLLDVNGRVKEQVTSSTGLDGYAAALYKIGTAAEAAGVWYSFAKDSGNPGAWAPGAPGLAGRATDGTAAADAGCIPYRNAASGANYLSAFSGAGSVVGHGFLFDVLWANSGIVVTTTTAQTVNSVALPARDIAGTANGRGCWAGLLVTTATTNAGAITGTTISYTNSAGVGGRTGTMASFPATAVIGTVVWFQLAAGDEGVQSIQSVTLGTSYVAGAVSLIIARPLDNMPNLTAYAGTLTFPARDPGTHLYDGTCMLLFWLASTTTAVTFTGLVKILNR